MAMSGGTGVLSDCSDSLGRITKEESPRHVISTDVNASIVASGGRAAWPSAGYFFLIEPSRRSNSSAAASIGRAKGMAWITR